VGPCIPSINTDSINTNTKKLAYSCASHYDALFLLSTPPTPSRVAGPPPPLKLLLLVLLLLLCCPGHRSVLLLDAGCQPLAHLPQGLAHLLQRLRLLLLLLLLHSRQPGALLPLLPLLLLPLVSLLLLLLLLGLCTGHGFLLLQLQLQRKCKVCVFMLE
jgi:hypothetical protein